MDAVKELCIFNTMVLNEYSKLNYYPKDITQIINGMYYNLFRIKIKCGNGYSIMLFNNKVYVWGANEYGELGLGHTNNVNSPQKLNLENIIKISCGSFHSMAITNANQVYVWGDNGYCQLGLGHNNKVNSPQKLNLENIIKISCGGYHSIAITNSNQVYVWGNNKHGQLGLGHNNNVNSPQKLNLDNIIKISCGRSHSMAITNSNQVYVWVVMNLVNWV